METFYILGTEYPKQKPVSQIANDGRLNSWIDANLKWLKDTFGEENLVSCVLHMDEKTPHLHATVVPIVTGERIRRKREGEKNPALGGRCDAAHTAARIPEQLRCGHETVRVAAWDCRLHRQASGELGILQAAGNPI